MKALEVEITPEMIKAGVSALCLWETNENPETVCLSVFSAMMRARSPEPTERSRLIEERREAVRKGLRPRDRETDAE